MHLLVYLSSALWVAPQSPWPVQTKFIFSQCLLLFLLKNSVTVHAGQVSHHGGKSQVQSGTRFPYVAKLVWDFQGRPQSLSVSDHCSAGIPAPATTVAHSFLRILEARSPGSRSRDYQWEFLIRPSPCLVHAKTKVSCLLFSFKQVFAHILGWLWTHYVAQVGLRPATPWPQPPEGWDWRSVQPFLGLRYLMLLLRGLVIDTFKTHGHPPLPEGSIHLQEQHLNGPQETMTP